MRISKAEVNLFLVTLAVVAAMGCASSGPSIVLPADTSSAPQANLEALFDQISTQLAAAKPGSNAATQLENQLRTVGGELAQRGAASIRTELSAVERIDGKLPLGAVEQSISGLDSIKRWDEGVYRKLSSELELELESTRAAIASQEQNLAAVADDDALDRLRILSDLSALSGTGSEKQVQYTEQRDEILREVSREAEEAIRNEDYEKAQSLLGIVQEVNPEDDTTRLKKCEVDGKVLLKRFNRTLETGRVGQSTAMLTEFSQTDCFSEVRDGLADSAAPIAEAFGLLGEEAASVGNLATAYQRYRDSHQIHELLLGTKGDLPGIEMFLGKVDVAYESAFEASEFGLAWGYLTVLEEFRAPTPQMRQRIRVTRDEVTRRAVRGVTAYPFADSPASAAKVGDAVASKVVQHIFLTIPSDVRIVEREQLERILGECERVGDCADLDTADFIVQGSILDAKVETTEKSGSETRRVVTGVEAIVNPDHTHWSQMSDRDRKKAEEPPRTISRDVTEDVSIEVTSVRKVGIISVSYRVIEANSGRVLFTDSIQTKQEFQDEGRQGIRLGDFQQETDFVELPPDIEILSGNSGLADRISEEIGVKLVEFLQNPEDQYVIEAKRFETEGDFTSAARKAAYAMILREDKSKEMGDLSSELKRYAMLSPGT